MIYGGFTMLRVSVAEDNPKDRERLLSFLKKYGEEKDVQIEDGGIYRRKVNFWNSTVPAMM